MTLAVAVVLGVLLGVIAALKVIAPLTKSKADDKVLDLAEKAEAVIEPLVKK